MDSLHDLEFQDIASKSNFGVWGKDTFLKDLKIKRSEKEVKQIQIQCMSLKKDDEIRNTLDNEYKHINTKLVDYVLENNDPRIEEKIHQILWKEESIGRVLNTNSIYLNFIIFWKSIFLPCLAIVLPLFALILPYVFLCFQQKTVDTNEYLRRLRHVILQQITIPIVLRSRGTNDFVGFLLERLFIGITIATFIASIWNQITPALHLRNIWNELVEQGDACISLIRWLQNWKRLCTNSRYNILINRISNVVDKYEYLCNTSPVVVYSFFRSHREELREIKDLCGYLDVILGISKMKQITFTRFSSKTYIKKLFHPLLDECIRNNIDEDKSTHILLTGPNRGGKSTFLKSYGIAVVTSLSWGFCWAYRATIPFYKSYYISLVPAPVLGKTSTFEAEIDYAKTVCESNEFPKFVLMDEIFHSTNATDGVAATKIFLDRLYSQQNAHSIISTHYHSIAKEYNVLKYMMETFDEGDSIRYTYRIIEGINTRSTVMDILTERGLCVPLQKQTCSDKAEDASK